MAIIIPSKNIYPPINNPKIRGNVIDKVSVGLSKITTVYESKNAIFSKEIDVSVDSLEKIENEVKTDFKCLFGQNNVVHYSLSYLNNIVSYFVGTIEIPKVANNSYVKNLAANDFVSFSIYGKKKTGEIDFEVTANLGATAAFTTFDMSVPKVTAGEEEIGILDFPDLPIKVTEDNSVVSLTSAVTGLPSESYLRKEEKEDKYVINFKILCYCLSQPATGYASIGKAIEQKIYMWGQYQELIAEKISLTVYGDTIGIDLTEGTVTFGNGSKPFSIAGNELLQSEETAKSLGDTILKQYEQGKETAEIVCGINEYFDEENHKILSTSSFSSQFNFENVRVEKISTGGAGSYSYSVKFSIEKPFFYDLVFYAYYEGELGSYATLKSGETSVTIHLDSKVYPIIEDEVLYSKHVEYTPLMTFQHGFSVIPMIFSPSMKDIPMSLKKDGTPKEFTVCGVEMIYDGAVYQKLYLQEI